jgi:hypothetical protein
MATTLRLLKRSTKQWHGKHGHLWLAGGFAQMQLQAIERRLIALFLGESVRRANRQAIRGTAGDRSIL